jgi:hypothetical protein
VKAAGTVRGVHAAVILVLFVLMALSESYADALSGLGQFWFLNPGVTVTKGGPGFEFSGGRMGLGSGKGTLLGGLVRHEYPHNRTEVGLEAGIAVFLLEMGISFSDRGEGEFIAPDLCIPIPASDKYGMAINLFYRVYPRFDAENTFGASIKFAWMH